MSQVLRVNLVIEGYVEAKATQEWLGLLVQKAKKECLEDLVPKVIVENLDQLVIVVSKVRVDNLDQEVHLGHRVVSCLVVARRLSEREIGDFFVVKPMPTRTMTTCWL